MDPDANLGELLALARGLVDLDPSDATEYVGEVNRLSELVLALDEWIVKGGFLPARWGRDVLVA